MQYDYSALCSCQNFEVYDDTLKGMREQVRDHKKEKCGNYEGWIERHFRGSDIDDSFPDHPFK